MQRLTRSFAPKLAAAGAVATQGRQLHFPLSRPPVEFDYTDEDTLEFAMRTEARTWGFDDLQYVRELAFVRINDNPTVGEFRNMTVDQRREMFWGSDRQDFYMWFTWKVLGKPEHLYHEGYNY
jgi:hypothetical protein